MVELIDEADLHATHAGLFIVRQPAAIDAVDEHLAPIGTLKQSRNVEQGRFAGAGGAKQSDSLAGKERSGRALQHLDTPIALGIGPLEPFKAKIVVPWGLTLSAGGAGEQHAYGMAGLWTGTTLPEPNNGASFDGGNGHLTGWGAAPSIDQM